MKIIKEILEKFNIKLLKDGFIEGSVLFDSTDDIDDKIEIQKDINAIFNNKHFKEYCNWYMDFIVTNTLKYGNKENAKDIPNILRSFFYYFYNETERMSTEYDERNKVKDESFDKYKINN